MKERITSFIAISAFCFAALITRAFAAVPAGPSIVRTEGRTIVIQRRLPDNSLTSDFPYIIRGVCFQPLEIGDTHTNTEGRLYSNRNKDLPIVKDLNANTVRLYGSPSIDSNGIAFLDACYENGIMVIVTALPSFGTRYLSVVSSFKNHPAVLAWMLGNEFNYNLLYTVDSENPKSLDECITLISNAIHTIKTADPNHPVIVGWGDPSGLSRRNYDKMSHADIFSFNMYRGVGFTTAFTSWEAFSDKPMFVSEYGADAYNANIANEDQAAQAYATGLLTAEITNNLAVLDAAKVCSGGTLFAYSDEWWKHSQPDVHNTESSFANAIYPDNIAHEEWWGIVDIHRNKRDAYFTLQAIYAEIAKLELLIMSVPQYAGVGSHTVRLLSPSTIVSPSLFVTNEDGASNFITLSRHTDAEWQGTFVVSNGMKNGVWYFEGAATVDGENFHASTRSTVDTVPPTAPANFIAKKASATTVAATWNASIDEISGVQKYVVTRSVSPSPYETTNLSYTHSIRTVTADYIDYTIYAVDYAGNKGEEATARFLVDSEGIMLSSRTVSETDPLSVSAYMAKGSVYRMDIFDTKGNRVMRVAMGAAEADGTYRLSWNGEDIRGKQLPKGLYYIKTTVGNKSMPVEKVFVQ